MAHRATDVRESELSLARRRAVWLLLAMVAGVFVLIVIPLVGGGMLGLDYVEFWRLVGATAWAYVVMTWMGKATLGVIALLLVVWTLQRFIGPRKSSRRRAL